MTCEKDHFCKHRLVIVLRTHIDCYFSLAVFFFHCHSLPVHYQPSRGSKLLQFSLCLFTFVGDFGRELSFKRTSKCLFRE